jgi:hypothetical protein
MLADAVTAAVNPTAPGRRGHLLESTTIIRRRLAGAALAAVTATGVLVSGGVPAQATHSDLQARLDGGCICPAARGLADYAGKHGHDHRALDVSVRHISRLDGRTLVVYVHGVRLGRMTVSSHGRAHLHRHNFSAIQGGWPIRIRTRSAMLVAAGTFTHAAGERAHEPEHPPGRKLPEPLMFAPNSQQSSDYLALADHRNQRFGPLGLLPA